MPTYPCRPFVRPGLFPPASYLRYQADETHLSAQQTEACPHAWLSCPHGNQGRPPRAQAPTREGPCQADPVTCTGRQASRRRGKPLDSRRSHRFSKDDRLRDSASYSRVFNGAQRSRDRLFTVLCRSNGATDARLGLAVSKKHAKKAVERNRIKRVVRESFRENKSRLAGLDVVVINQSGTGQAANAGLFASLDAHWDRCCKLRNSRKSLDNG